MKTDSLFYRLFQRAPKLVFELAGLEAFAAGAYQFRAEEIKQTAFRLDGVLVPSAEQSEAPVVFVEVQAQPDPEFYGRFFAELLLYLYRNRPPHPWRAVVIYPTRAEERLNGQHYGSLVGLLEVRRVYLEDFRDRPVTDAGVGLIQLIASEPEGSLARATRLLEQARTAFWTDWPTEQLADFVETILVYKLPKLSREEIQTMLGLIDTDLKQTRFYQEVFAEGRQEGRQEESVQLALRLLRRRLGAPLAPAHEQRVRCLSLEQAEALMEALLDFRTPADLTAWLAAHEMPSA
ncbi:MAG: DUF2887 domain-containing protein [Candidatus Competibacteraceae bacterium]